MSSTRRLNCSSFLRSRWRLTSPRRVTKNSNEPNACFTRFLNVTNLIEPQYSVTGAADVELTPDDLAAIESASAKIKIKGLGIRHFTRSWWAVKPYTKETNMKALCLGTLAFVMALTGLAQSQSRHRPKVLVPIRNA